MIRQVFMPHLRAGYDDLRRGGPAASDLLVSHRSGVRHGTRIVAEVAGMPWVYGGPLNDLAAVEARSLTIRPRELAQAFSAAGAAVPCSDSSGSPGGCSAAGPRRFNSCAEIWVYGR